MLSTVYGISSQTSQLSRCHHETHDFSSDLTVSKPHFSQSVVPDLLIGCFNPFWKGWIVTICHLKSRMKPWKYRIATPLPDENHLAIGQGLCFGQKKMLLHCACGGWTCPLSGDAIDHTHISRQNSAASWEVCPLSWSAVFNLVTLSTGCPILIIQF